MPSYWSNTSLDVAVRVFVDVINVYNQLTLSKADYPTKCGWILSIQKKALRRRNSASRLQHRNLG